MIRTLVVWASVVLLVWGASGTEMSRCSDSHCEPSLAPGTVTQNDRSIASLACRVIDVIGEEGAPKLALLLMHGLGSQAADLVPLAHHVSEQWASRGQVHLRIVVMNGPLSMGGSRRAWFSLAYKNLMTPTTDITAMDIPELDAASDAVMAVMNQLQQEGFERFILSGFSQGAILSAHVAARYPTPAHIVGLGLLSGSIRSRALWEQNLPRYSHATVMMSHGHGDPVLPFSQAMIVKSIFENANIPVTLVAFEGGHTTTSATWTQLAHTVNEIATKM